MATGLALLVPIMSLPMCRHPGSKRAYSYPTLLAQSSSLNRAGLTRPMLQPGTIPGPPTRAAPMFEVMLPYKLGMTMTSNCWGFETNCIELREQDQPRSSEARDDSRVVDDHGVECDTRALVLLCDGLARVQEETVTELHDVGLVDTGDLLLARRNRSAYIPTPPRPERTFRPFFNAKSNANLAIRSALARVLTFKFSTTPGKLWCSRPAYSPSVFSRMMTKSTFWCRVGTPGRDLQTTTEA